MVLIVTNEADYYTVDLVREGLKKRGMDVVRLDMDTFPLAIHLAETVSNSGNDIRIKANGQSFSANEIEGIWLRKYWVSRVNEELEPAYRSGVQRESQEVMDIFLKSFPPNLPFMDRWENIRKASDKYLQLQICAELGIQIPATIITNDILELRKFHKGLNGKKMCCKLLTALSASMTASGFFLYTSMVAEKDLEDENIVGLSPLCFQEYIPKAYELRIIYVDGQFFSAKIDASKSKKGQVDWRQSNPDEVVWEKYTLSSELEGLLRQFMERIGLSFGAIDLIRSQNGEYVFLEVNPTGEWGMLERDLGLPIAERIAETIFDKITKAKK